ncbi:FHA domain-containing protein [Dysosmobacter welbionis]|uniref:FHA domain-containing protein n=1 Tax=Dysosmobacter welbionis TaxID=2093857 RepID=UPI0032BFBC86
MSQIECGRGHLYDPDKYPVCPYCNTNQKITVAAAGRTAPISATEPQRTAPLSGVSAAAPQRTAPLSTPVMAAQKTAPLSGISATAPQKTAPLSGVSVTAPQKTMPPRGYEPGPAPAGVSVTAAGKTVGMMQSQMGFDPVVGWLACVAGPSRGKSYTIRGGINAIGRGDRMDIVITGDLKISSENHAKISYSDKHNRFNLLPGDGRNIIYLNDEEVFSPMPLKAYDLIDFGETKLLFIPLCGERFTWQKEEDHGAV